ncbi:MAG TPA: trehalose-phosphatase [Gammaproteobacteria bacterium]|nr:trehalose-phosphatase [Gammaproteobacteria bacterium]
MVQTPASTRAAPAAANPPAFATGWAFFLDIDGTLARLAHAPDAVTIEPAVIDVLRRLGKATGGAIALITGRAITDVDRLFAPLKLPVAGQHGIERRSADGRLARHAEAARKLDTARRALTEFANSYAGLIFEDKGETLALHYRGAPACRGAAKWLMTQQLEQLGPEFMLQHGKMIFELRPSGRDKGTAIAEFMHEPPFENRTPVFIGDDKTDEDGFKVVNQLGGHAIKVGPGKTIANFRLESAADVLRWLQNYADFLTKRL